MYKAFSKPRVLIRRRPSTSRTTNVIERLKFHTSEPRRYAEPDRKRRMRRRKEEMRTRTSEGKDEYKEEVNQAKNE
ncbi:uncharacterized protein EAE98_002020 [Botrytis deweyae]|uniref:Uncharacterized protein n=1 Tax=Botrytis deweyae TaxID=2478750 RepID=A0ABQ7IW03_9HELO|nr:uncharacterized protein EAE98_002020 [Botrytis deweyae]KAF7935800.1 hypothetical protein EAE98_002020 [Botrytis deweyae]